jgi:UDP-glucose 4-epimerase
MNWAVLRYFNVAGARNGTFADRRSSSLLPIVLGALQYGKTVDVFGTDWPTPDGTCVRDYVHVEDLADAHVAMVEALCVDAIRKRSLQRWAGRGR